MNAKRGPEGFWRQRNVFNKLKKLRVSSHQDLKCKVPRNMKLCSLGNAAERRYIAEEK